MQCIPCHGKDEKAFFDALFGALQAQNNKLATLIEQKKAQGKKLSQEERTIAILVRSNWQVESVVNEAQKRDINIEVLIRILMMKS